MRKYIISILISIFMTFVGASCQNTPKNLGVFGSDDGGNTWQAKVNVEAKKTIKNLEINSIKIDPLDSKIIYLGTEGQGVYKTSNSGENWQQTSLGSGNVYSVDVDPKDNSVVYAAGYFNNLGKIYKSNSNGDKFEEIYSETHDKASVFSISVDSYDPRKIYAGTESGSLLKSKDSGRSWILQKNLENKIVQISINPHDTRHILVGTASKGIFKTEDGGETWKDLEKSLKDFSKASQTYSIVFDPKNLKKVYFTSSYGFLISDDEGESWKNVNILSEPKRKTVLKIAVDSADSPNIFLSQDSTIYKTSDNGQSWKVNKVTDGIIKALACDPKNYQVIYVGVGKVGE